MLIIESDDKLVWNFYCLLCLEAWRKRGLKNHGYSDNEIEEIKPNFDLLKQLPGQGLIISSLGEKYDFVSRYFCPKFGINEDPVTGSAHTTLIPYWSDKLNKKELRAKQISKRGGELFCINEESRVLIGGNATLYMKGEIEIN